MAESAVHELPLISLTNITFVLSTATIVAKSRHFARKEEYIRSLKDDLNKHTMNPFKTFIIFGALCIMAVSAHSNSDSDESNHSNINGHHHSNGHDGSHEKNCGKCGEIHRSCSRYDGTQNCFKPKVQYFIDKHGCQSAVIRCKNYSYSKTQTLKTSRGDTLFTGEGSEKMATCKNNEWKADDYQGDYAHFSTVFCINDQVQGQYQQPGY